jgi:hypothetical protein
VESGFVPVSIPLCLSLHQGALLFHIILLLVLYESRFGVAKTPTRHPSFPSLSLESVHSFVSLDQSLPGLPRLYPLSVLVLIQPSNGMLPAITPSRITPDRLRFFLRKSFGLMNRKHQRIEKEYAKHPDLIDSFRAYLVV